jgi:hypothetical protein
MHSRGTEGTTKELLTRIYLGSREVVVGRFSVVY